MKTETILPIAIDLGAKNTGVYAAAYSPGTILKDFSTDNVLKMAFVATSYAPDEGGYMLLQNGRTANRHMQRNRTRNRQAKKLFKIILECLVGFNVEKHHEAIAHFMNRRGYSYVEEQVSAEDLSMLTSEQLLPLTQVLTELGHEGIVEEFERANPVEALRCIASQGASQLEALITAFQKLPKKPKLGKAQIALRESAKLYLKDLSGGAVHRSKYFGNLAHDFNKLRKHPERHCRRFFHALNDLKQSEHGYQKEDVLRLLCHVSNFDLKLLNRILNALPEHPTETLLKTVLTKHVSKWILKQWALSESNGKARLQEIRELRCSLKQHLATKHNEIVSFLLDTPPEQTIPPYESHTNRRPPNCQTLLLNSKYLNDAYKDWRNWLGELMQASPRQDEIQSYREQLAAQVSNQGRRLITAEELDARTLQLILDTSKAIDPHKLNAIWSHLKDYHLRLRTGQDSSGVMHKLEEALKSSELPEVLKQVHLTDTAQGSFWHLVNRYYQARRKCREGRYFIFVDRTQQSQHKRWQNDGKLLAMCHHRPKQIKHQGLQDMRVLLGLNQQQLPKKVVLDQSGEVNLGTYLLQIKGLKKACDDARKAQKQWGSELNDNLTTDKTLITLAAKIHELLPALSQQLKLDESSSAAFIERNQSIYQFAQLYQMAWGDRSGFASTCPVCATDNAVRMADNSAKAQAPRLNTLSMRLIDGGIKRHLNHQAHHIGNRIWDQLLQPALLKGDKITLPLILEQNSFDFAENLHKLKGTLKPRRGSVPDQFQPKLERIKQASHGVCPYDKLSTKLAENGDVDHIIPRSGRYGTLNDEANLIYASHTGNRQIKGNRELTLDDLTDVYLEKQFPKQGNNRTAIQKEIEQRLTGEREDIFSFGRYRQFRALTPENQVAFRHALFLPADHPLRALVISTLQHHSKSRVNGTQRFMAQLLADTLWQKAKELGKQGNLTFDYFEVSSDPNNEASTVTLRRHLESSTLTGSFDLQPFTKRTNQSQQDYSHVIDATLAFLLSVQAHPNEGAMRVNLAEGETIWSQLDNDGVYLNTAFEQVAVLPEQLSPQVEVKPRATHTKVSKLLDGTKPHQAISRRIFKQNALGLQFYDFQSIDGQLFRGWVAVESGQAEFVKHAGDKSKPADKNLDKIQRLVDLGYFCKQRVQGLYIYRANKQALLGYIFDALSQAKLSPQPKQEQSQLVSWLLGKGAGNLYYYTSSKELSQAPSVLRSKGESPYKKHWIDFYNGWKTKAKLPVKQRNGVLEIASDEQANWQAYCQSFLGKGPKKETSKVFQPAHTASHDFTMRTLGNSSGVPSLIRKVSAKGFVSYYLMDINTGKTGVFGKEQSPALALASKNVVLFDREVLQKGYMADTTPKLTLEAIEIPIAAALNTKNCQVVGLALNPIKVVIEANKLHIKNIERQWFEANLLLKNEADEKPWWEKSKLYCSGQTSAEGGHSIAQDSFKKLFKKGRGAKHDKGMALKVEDDKVSVTLVLDKKVTQKILEEITQN